jgi:glycosyltransferase involved in cell wall biosynthesis
MIYADIILVTWNRPDLTQQTIETLMANTDRKHYRLIVIDNHSSDDLRDMLWDYENQKAIDVCIYNEENYGLEPARNQGLVFATNKYLICMDNDILVPPRKFGQDWIQRLVGLMRKYPDYGAIGMRTQVMIGTGNIFEGKENKDIIDFPHPGGSARIMLTEPVKKVDGWRETMKGRGSEEKYICGKLHDNGWKTAFTVQLKCWHLFGDQNTDRWGYPKDWLPDDSGHSDIWHPALAQGDKPENINKFLETGEYE